MRDPAADGMALTETSGLTCIFPPLARVRIRLQDLGIITGNKAVLRQLLQQRRRQLTGACVRRNHS